MSEFNEIKTYKCICGKVFDNAQKFNGHKSNCKSHQIQKYGSLDQYNTRITKWVESGQIANHKRTIQCNFKTQSELQLWINAKHICETCGKIMTSKYASGRFCSRACANTHTLSEHTKQKIANTLKAKNINPSHCETPRFCRICSKEIRKNNKSGYCITCYKLNREFSDSTKQKLRIAAINRNFGGFNYRNKGIYYRNIKLDSSYEVKVAESLDANNIKWVRPKALKYVDDKGKQRHYIPDFYLPDYNVYLDPKNDYLINNINNTLGFSDTEKIMWAATQNSVKILILNKEQLSWDVIKSLIDNK